MQVAGQGYEPESAGEFDCFTSVSGPNSRPDIYTFAPTDAVPDALVLQCSTVAGEIDGDEP